ncbi:hypothetical protein FQR65_LT08480 [Abscondita terminalis]|nr:hypothetical protein FQR65_LT08480 [Abscondita terminalis]
MATPCVTLNNGQKMPRLGLGTWQLAPGEVEKVVEIAIDAGYRHFDCAFLYDNEAEIGSAIRKKIADENFGLDYLDQYLIHWPITIKSLSKEVNVKYPFRNSIGVDYDFVETWRAMEECVRLGLTKGIGISNFNSKQIDRIVKAATIKPVVNQIEVTPLFNQKKLIKFCKEHGIEVTAYGPLGSPTRPWAKEGDPVLFLDSPELLSIGKKYGKTPAQVVLRYLIEMGITPIPKSANSKRLTENIQIFDFSLSPEDVTVLDSFNSDKGRVIGLEELSDMPNYPFLEEF